MTFPTEKALRPRVPGARREMPPVCVSAEWREGMSQAWTVSATIVKLEGHQRGHSIYGQREAREGKELAPSTRRHRPTYWSHTEA